MTVNRFAGFSVSAALALAAAPGLATSDYLLEIKGVQGEAGASDSSQTIEVSSYSWGASNPTSVGSGGLSAGKATGKAAAPAEVAASGPADAATATPKVGDLATVTVRYRESPTKSSTGKVSKDACAAGEHYKEVVLTGQGKRYVMQDVVVTSCVSANGERRKELTGHVTLIK